MNCNETFNAGICYVTDAYKKVCKFNEELHTDLEKYRAENVKLRELVKMSWGCVNSPNQCYKCQNSADGCALKSTMQELGIEVG